MMPLGCVRFARYLRVAYACRCRCGAAWPYCHMPFSRRGTLCQHPGQHGLCEACS